LSAAADAHRVAWNLLLLSYFMKEMGAIIIHILGVISTYAVLMQLAMVESMPAPQFVATSLWLSLYLFCHSLIYVPLQ
jgi:hypothetical protein